MVSLLFALNAFGSSAERAVWSCRWPEAELLFTSDPFTQSRLDLFGPDWVFAEPMLRVLPGGFLAECSSPYEDVVLS